MRAVEFRKEDHDAAGGLFGTAVVAPAQREAVSRRDFQRLGLRLIANFLKWAP